MTAKKKRQKTRKRVCSFSLERKMIFLPSGVLKQIVSIANIETGITLLTLYILQEYTVHLK